MVSTARSACSSATSCKERRRKEKLCFGECSTGAGLKLQSLAGWCARCTVASSWCCRSLSALLCDWASDYFCVRCLLRLRFCSLVLLVLRLIFFSHPSYPLPSKKAVACRRVGACKELSRLLVSGLRWTCPAHSQNVAMHVAPPISLNLQTLQAKSFWLGGFSLLHLAESLEKPGVDPEVISFPGRAARSGLAPARKDARLLAPSGARTFSTPLRQGEHMHNSENANADLRAGPSRVQQETPAAEQVRPVRLQAPPANSQRAASERRKGERETRPRDSADPSFFGACSRTGVSSRLKNIPGLSCAVASSLRFETLCPLIG